MKKSYAALAFIMCIGASAGYAQQTAVPFLLIAPDARASSMGETGTGLSDDAAAMYWNVGGLAYQKKPELFMTYSRWLPQFGASDLFYGYIDGVKEMPDWGGTAGLNMTWLNLGQFEMRSPDNQYLGTFRSFEFALAGAYGTKLSTDVGFGMQLRYIYSSLAPQGSGQEQGHGIGQSVSFDLGVLWRPDSLVLFDAIDLSKVISVGLTLTNVGPKITYIDAAQADPLPTNLRLGLAYKAVHDDYNDLTFTADFAKLMVHSTSTGSDPLPKSLITAWESQDSISLAQTIQTSLGAEYIYDNVVALRAGYFYESPQVGGRNFLTFGAGLRYDIYSLDFSYISTFQPNDPLANTLRFTLGFDFE
ncbi:MAG TPA: type IX secretion system outer membrane channel protein PorV [Candidatus Kapabacteria bacterium]|nr:type IX secretion system outer membrane channel protein PorV [Candidatus Kapabacteria bacterium]